MADTSSANDQKSDTANMPGSLFEHMKWILENPFDAEEKRRVEAWLQEYARLDDAAHARELAATHDISPNEVRAGVVSTCPTCGASLPKPMIFDPPPQSTAT